MEGLLNVVPHKEPPAPCNPVRKEQSSLPPPADFGLNKKTPCSVYPVFIKSQGAKLPPTHKEHSAHYNPQSIMDQKEATLPCSFPKYKFPKPIINK